jgi:hypothetical protein
MPEGSQNQHKAYLKVQLWHLLAMAILFVWSIGVTIQRVAAPADLRGDLIVVALCGVVLTFFGWIFYIQRS